MELLQIHCEKAIPSQCGSTYKGITFDGCYFYFTCPNLNKIVKYDKHFCEIECVNTQRPYACICYDQQEHCFWASGDKCFNKLFKLNCSLAEIDCLTIRSSECCGAKITGVSYDCQHNCLLVSCGNCILSICTSECNNETLIQKRCPAGDIGILSVSPNYIVTEKLKTIQYISVYDDTSMLKCQYEIPCCYFVENIIFNPCTLHCDGNHHFYLLTTKNGCYPYLWECVFDCCNFEICECNYKICSEPNCEPDCHHSLNACNDIIESIALIETSISHILNAEGEKLQKIIACSNNTDEILCANKAINETIVKITHLEIILHDKLSTIKDYCKLCENKEISCSE